MGTIEKRGKDSWRVGVQVKTPAGWKWVRRTVHINPALSEARQRKEADKALLQLQLEVEQGELAPAGHDYTVRTWAEFWMEQHVKPECSPVTYAGYRYLLDSRILPLLGDIPLERLTPLRLTEWLNQVRESPRRSTRMDDEQLAHPRKPSAKLAPASAQKKPLSRKTVLHYYTCMESMLSAAVRLEVLDANPMDKVLRPKVKRPKINALSEERAVELLRDTSAPREFDTPLLLPVIAVSAGRAESFPIIVRSMSLTYRELFCNLNKSSVMEHIPPSSFQWPTL